MSVPDDKSGNWQDAKEEEGAVEQAVHVSASSTRKIKVDKNGVPLSPQPSDSPEDPLNWPTTYRVFVLLQVSLLSAIGTLNPAIINPAYGQLSQEFGVSLVTASYQTTVAIAVCGIGPFLFTPLANVYGRRPIYLLTTFIGFASALGCAYVDNYSQLIGARIVNGIFPIATSLGVATVTDMFCLHERGRALGVYTVLTTNGGHFAPIPGGLIGQYLGWRWIFKFTAICDGFALIFLLFFLPETLYIRDYGPASPPSLDSKTEDSMSGLSQSGFERHVDRLKFRGRFPGRRLDLSQFVWPYIEMMRYPSVLFPAVYYAVQFGLGSILSAVTVSQIFTEKYGWNTMQIGVAYGVALLIGSFLGETAGGWVVDSIMNRARRRSPSAPSEIRLQAIWTGEILVPIGLILYGFSVQFRTPWIVPLIGMAIACFGVQCITTVLYTYSTDCYRDKSAEVSQVFNFIRQEIGMTFAFYAIPLAQAMGGYHWLFLLFACLGSILAFIPILILMWKGESIRRIVDPR